MENGILLNVVVVEGCSIFELLSCIDKALLVWRNFFIGLDLAFHVVDGV